MSMLRVEAIGRAPLPTAKLSIPLPCQATTPLFSFKKASFSDGTRSVVMDFIVVSQMADFSTEAE